MYITENLSWQAHICSLCHNLSKTYYIIKSLKNILRNCMLWNIYFAYFQLWLGCGIILWGGTRESIKVLHIQKRWLNYRYKKYESCRQKFKENRIIMVASLYILEVLCFVKKCKRDLQQTFVIHEHNSSSKYDYINNFVIHLCFKKVY
jgi:hypothetical protein